MNPLIKSMRLRTLPLSLAGVVCGGLLALGSAQAVHTAATVALLALTTVGLQVLSNLSNEMGDYRSGVDGASREGPAYGMANGLTPRQLWRAINCTVVACCVLGVLMVWCSFGTVVGSLPALLLVLLGAAAIWAATHYTLGKRPYGYQGLGDLFVFVFFGLVSVLGSYYVVAHTVAPAFWLAAPAVGIGLLSVAVLNVNNIRDMQSDLGLRRTVPLRLGLRRARIYQTVLVLVGYAALIAACRRPILLVPAAPLLGWHLRMVWSREGRALDPALPLLVLTTFGMSILYIIGSYGVQL